MAEIRDFVDIQAVLQTATAPRASFGVNMLLKDTPAVTIEQRFKSVTRDNFSTELAGDAVAIAYATTYFAQSRIADKLFVGRWDSANETLTEAAQAIDDVTGEWYNLQIRRNDADPSVTVGVFETQALALAQWIQTQTKQLDILDRETDAHAELNTTSLGQQITALSLNRVSLFWTSKDSEHPDAAAVGAVLPADEGTTSFAFERLANVTESGSGSGLSVSERERLVTRGYQYIETVGTGSSAITFNYNGVTSGGEEKRIMLGRDWFIARISELIFTDQINSEVNNFDNETLAKIGQFILQIAEEAFRRKILVNTAERPFVLNIPDADDITAAQRATRELQLTEAFSGYINSAINDYQLVGTWLI